MVQMNFEKTIVNTVLASLNWATAEEEYKPSMVIFCCFQTRTEVCTVVPPSDLPEDEIRSERQKSRLKKRKGLTDALTNTREELFAGDFDAYVT